MTTEKQKIALARSFESGHQERQDYAKIAKLKDSFTSGERARYQNIRTSLEIGLARNFGTKLPPICVERLLDRTLLDGDIYSAVVSGQDSYLPQTQSEWQAYAASAAHKDEFATAAIVNADYKWKKSIRETALDELTGREKLAKERAGSLSDYLDAKVQDAEDERCAGIGDA